MTRRPPRIPSIRSLASPRPSPGIALPKAWFRRRSSSRRIRIPRSPSRCAPCLKALQVLGAAAADFSRSGADSDSIEAAAAFHQCVIGDFRIIRRIGRGGMGIVYEAEQISLGRHVAVKVLPFAGMLDPRSLKRFENEVMAAANLDHPNIVDVYGVACEGGCHHYAMRLIDGPSLAEVIGELRRRRDSSEAYPVSFASDSLQIRRGRSNSAASGETGEHAYPLDAEIPADPRADPQSRLKTHRAESTQRLRALHQPASHFRTLAELGASVAEALDHAHQQGVVHRDVKPANLLLDSNGKPWITDFGLALVENNLAFTMTGEMLGTAPYMSPEQILAQRVLIDHRTDIYSLGVTLYELSTLLLPFDAADRNSLYSQIRSREPTAPASSTRPCPRTWRPSF